MRYIGLLLTGFLQVCITPADSLSFDTRLVKGEGFTMERLQQSPSGHKLYQSLALLFSPPTKKEINAVLADWQGRDPVAKDWTVESEANLRNGPFMQVISHTVDCTLFFHASYDHGVGGVISTMQNCWTAIIPRSSALALRSIHLKTS